MHRLKTVLRHIGTRGVSTFKAGYFEKTADGPQFSVRELQLSDLPQEAVLVQIDYSTLNYKDALAITNAGPIIKTFPMVGGVDYAGTVMESDDPDLKVGDKVVMNGWGAGETHWGGYSQFMRTKAAHLLPLPPRFSTYEAMAIGTAGYTAMLCILKLVDHGVTPAHGPVLVTGATGGVGSFAVAMLSSMGYRTLACTGRKEEHAAYLESLGAAEVVDREILSGKPKPLGKQLYAGCVDTVGGTVLANVLANMQYGGIVAATGLAGGAGVNTTVMPFILRDVTLAGVDSVMIPKPNRIRAWTEMAKVLDAEKLKIIVPEDALIGLEGLPSEAPKVIAGAHRGRLIVDVNR